MLATGSGNNIANECPTMVCDSVFMCSWIGAANCIGRNPSNFMDEQLENDNSSAEVSSYFEEPGILGSCKRNNGSYPSRSQLEKEVQLLEQQLQEELELHAILENAIERSAVKLSSPSCLPHHAHDLISNIAVLEATVSKLQQEMVSLRFRLCQERNERTLAEFCPTHSSSQNAVDPVLNIHQTKVSEIKETKPYQPIKFGKLKEISPNNLSPNELSEEMVRCMKKIFISLADSPTRPVLSSSESQCSSLSPRGHLSSSSLSSFSDRSMISSCMSPQVDLRCKSEVLATENACDPYTVRGKLSWAEIGSYGMAIEVSWMSVGKKELEYAAEALRIYRTLVEQLAKMNPIQLSGNERLAFWMNLYNALIMHAYLAYGVPRTDLKLFSLMQKAAYNVGGHSFSAAAIEYALLKMKPPAHRPQLSLLFTLHKLKVSEEQRKFAIESFEPRVAFALSCGMHSSPAVRIYTAKNVKQELQEAQCDFIRASVGVSSKGRLLVPRMLHCFARDFAVDGNLLVWISGHLPSHQTAFVEQCISQRRRQSLVGSHRNYRILSFDTRFRYLFLPDKLPCVFGNCPSVRST